MPDTGTANRFFVIGKQQQSKIHRPPLSFLYVVFVCYFPVRLVSLRCVCGSFHLCVCVCVSSLTDHRLIVALKYASGGRIVRLCGYSRFSVSALSVLILLV